MLMKFGSYGTIYALAGGDILKTESVVKKSVREIITFLYYRKELRAYEDRYRKIINPPQQKKK